MKHTKTPWAVKHHGDVCSEVLDDEALAVAFVWGTQGQPNQANARHLVKCVNAHGDLVAACERVSESARVMSLPEGFFIAVDTMLQLRAVLAKVKET